MEITNKLSRSLETVGETDYLVVILSLFFCIISSFILMYVYKNKSNSLSSKRIDISSLEVGNYFIVVNTDSGKQLGKFVKTK